MSLAFDTQPDDPGADAAALSYNPGVDRCVLNVVVVTVNLGPPSSLWDSTVASSTATPMTSVLVELGLGNGISRALESRREMTRVMDRGG